MKTAKQLITSIILLALALASMSVPASNTKPLYVEFAVSNKLSAVDGERAKKEIVHVFLNHLCHPKDALVVVDALAQQQVTRFIMHEKIRDCSKKYNKWKVQLNKAAIAKLNWYFSQVVGKNKENVADLMIPDVLDSTAERIREFPGHAYEVVLWGSPLYVDRRNGVYSMYHAFPSDAHLTSQISVFSTVGREGSLNGAKVHIVHDGSFFNDIHRIKTKRFWTLYMQKRGASLVTYGRDGVTNRIGQNLQPYRETLNESETKEYMYSVRRTKIDMWKDIPQPPPPASTESGNLAIGIKWNCNCDLDLYSALNPDDVPLSYKHSSNNYGQHLKDYLAPPPGSGTKEYETVEYDQPVNSIRNVLTRVNFYSGRAPRGAEFEIRVMFNGALYYKKYKIEATSGNQGGDDPRRWVDVNLAEVVGLSA
jgi:hypothetical protein